ncbi:MAG: (Fe-S)-binding protein [Verrucomicrobiota bacterium]|jgi:glycolate oxidase iron-sulfur subunit|nr:(Fe-S)-binding protein [Verrucomicrobiota bacterium]
MPPAEPIDAPSFSHLKDLDYSVVQQCMHCGMCLPTCPTYDETKLERNSPRGRIALMRSIADGQLEATKTFADEMYFCLGCLACMTACPAGVNYSELFEHARAEVEEKKVIDSAWRRLVRRVTLKWLFTKHTRLKLLGRMIRLYSLFGFKSLVRGSRVLKLLPRRLGELEAMTPDIQPKFSDDLIHLETSAKGEKRYRVAMLTGCAQDLIFSDVNRDTVEVLARNGCEVYTPRNQGCCGSLHAHNGEWNMAQQQARGMLDLFPPGKFDAIISNAAGCGSHLKHYQALLKDDEQYADLAREWDAKLKDIHEWLAEIGVREPGDTVLGQAQKVAYHEACHLCHGQKITAQPRHLLKAIPGLELVELAESTWCCGSAGIYNIIQPEMANKLLERKVGHIRSTGAEVVAMGNPGCSLHITNGLAKCHSNIRVTHPVTLLAEAYRREPK